MSEVVPPSSRAAKISGRDALFAVEQAISRVRDDERGLDESLRSAIAETHRLRHELVEGFRSLARARLDAMVCDQVIGDLDETERQALAIVEGRRHRIDELARERDNAQAALDKAEAAKHERDQELADALEALDELRDRTVERMKSDDEWRKAKTSVEAAVEIADQADKKAAQAESDLRAKSKPYENDPLFMYLWKKKAGQPGDTSGGLARLFDSIVERSIGYRDALANYAMLKEVSVRLREHATNKEREIGGAKSHVAALERQALVADGIQPLETRAQTAHAAMASAEQAVAKITADLGKIEAKRQWILEADDGKSERRAVDLLAQALERENLHQLYSEAVSTRTSADDQAVSAISSAQTALQKADGEVGRIRAQLREMARRRAELEGARDRARSIGYDDPRVTFSGGRDLISDVIGGILSSALPGTALDRILRDNYRAPRSHADPDFGRWEGASPLLSSSPWGRGRNLAAGSETSKDGSSRTVGRS
jgi:chromosome segregation ATPase